MSPSKNNVRLIKKIKTHHIDVVNQNVKNPFSEYEGSCQQLSALLDVLGVLAVRETHLSKGPVLGGREEKLRGSARQHGFATQSHVAVAVGALLL